MTGCSTVESAMRALRADTQRDLKDQLRVALSAYDIASSSSSFKCPGTMATGIGNVPAVLATLDTSGPGPSLPESAASTRMPMSSSSSINLSISAAGSPSRTTRSGAILATSRTRLEYLSSAAFAASICSAFMMSATPSHCWLRSPGSMTRSMTICDCVRAARLAAQNTARSHSSVSSMTTRYLRLWPASLLRRRVLILAPAVRAGTRRTTPRVARQEPRLQAGGTLAPDAALLIRGLTNVEDCDGPGSASQHSMLRRARDTGALAPDEADDVLHGLHGIGGDDAGAV